VLGAKRTMLGCASAANLLGKLQVLLGEKPKLRFAPGLAADFPTNPKLHQAILYAKWSNWNRMPLAEAPLFYPGALVVTAEVMMQCSLEMIEIRDALMLKHPDVDPKKVKDIQLWLVDAYKEQIADASSLLVCLQSNAAYRGLKHPMKQTHEGLFPDFENRVMTEDLPMGLVPIRGLAELAGVATPTLVKVILWSQSILGKEYLRDGKLLGRDIGETRAPSNFRGTSTDALLW
jgi:hypothetical protein